MKKLLVSLLIGVSCFSFVGCNTHVSVEDGHVYVTKTYEKVEDIIKNEVSQEELIDIMNCYYQDIENNGSDIAWSNFKVGILSAIEDEQNVKTMRKALEMLDSAKEAGESQADKDFDNMIRSFGNDYIPSANMRNITQGQQ